MKKRRKKEEVQYSPDNGFKLKKREYLTFATTLFAIALTVRMIHALQEQGRSIPLTVAMIALISSLFAHYFLIFLKKNEIILLIHKRHHTKILVYYAVMLAFTLIVVLIDFALTGNIFTIAEGVFLFSMSTILSLVTYEITENGEK